MCKLHFNKAVQFLSRTTVQIPVTVASHIYHETVSSVLKEFKNKQDRILSQCALKTETSRI